MGLTLRQIAAMIRYSCALISNKMNFIPQVVKTEDNIGQNAYIGCNLKGYLGLYNFLIHKLV